MKEHIERLLKAESASASRGYLADRWVRRTVLLDAEGPGATEDPARWSTPPAEVAIAPLAGAVALLQRARALAR